MSISTGPTGGFGGWKDGPKRDYDDKHGRKDDGRDWKSKDDRHDGDKDGGKHGRKDDDHDWKSKDDRHDDKDGGKHGRKDDCDNDNNQNECEPVCEPACEPVRCEPEPDCDVHAALVGMSDIGSVVDFAIDSLSPGQGMDMGQFDMGAADSLGA
jgi:hypothetical protein